MSRERFKGQRILVCGGATGIGAATANLLASEGATVLVQYRHREAEARELCRRLTSEGASVDVVQADLTDSDQVGSLIRDVGLLHGIVHSVSPTLSNAHFYQSDWYEYEQHWSAAVKSAYWLLKCSLELEPCSLQSVVFVLSSYTIGVPPKNLAPYVSAKYALLGLCRVMALELADRKIRVNSISPGFTPTPLTAHIEPRLQEFMARGIPMGRLGTSEDAAMAAAFLLSEDSSFITGVNLPVAGGAVM
jgi:3-oxoacyl-[acyl-carrier protein] reductase